MPTENTESQNIHLRDKYKGMAKKFINAKLSSNVYKVTKNHDLQSQENYEAQKNKYEFLKCENFQI